MCIVHQLLKGSLSFLILEMRKPPQCFCIGMVHISLKLKGGFLYLFSGTSDNKVYPQIINGRDILLCIPIVENLMKPFLLTGTRLYHKRYLSPEICQRPNSMTRLKI